MIIIGVNQRGKISIAIVAMIKLVIERIKMVMLETSIMLKIINSVRKNHDSNANRNDKTITSLLIVKNVVTFMIAMI